MSVAVQEIKKTLITTAGYYLHYNAVENLWEIRDRYDSLPFWIGKCLEEVLDFPNWLLED
jgi:hypothetical protein